MFQLTMQLVIWMLIIFFFSTVRKIECCNKAEVEEKILNEEAMAVFKENPKYGGSLTISTLNGEMSIKGEVTGMVGGSTHGMHIHEFGDISDGCTSTGSHFNPEKKKHGSLTSSERHFGDLGNFKADSNGKLTISLSGLKLSLSGTNGILGRSFVIHEGEDDLGAKGDEGSITTGNAGARLTCAVISRKNTK